MTRVADTYSAEKALEEIHKKQYIEGLYNSNVPRTIGVVLLWLSVISAAAVLITGGNLISALIVLVSGVLTASLFIAIGEIVVRQNEIIGILWRNTKTESK